MLKNMRVAVCGGLDSACELLLSEGITQIDTYSDALDLVFKLRQGTVYHLILVYAPQGEGLSGTAYPYKAHLKGEWHSVPVRLLNEPACHSALLELKSTVHSICREMSKEEFKESGTG